MKISELPEDIKKIALLRQKECNINLHTDSIKEAFLWNNTKEKFSYWDCLHYKKI